MLAEGTAVEVYRRRGTARSLSLRYNPYKKVPLFVQDVIEVVMYFWWVTLGMGTVMLWFLVSTVSGPLGPSPRTRYAISVRIVASLWRALTDG